MFFLNQQTPTFKKNVFLGGRRGSDPLSDFSAKNASLFKVLLYSPRKIYPSPYKHCLTKKKIFYASKCKFLNCSDLKSQASCETCLDSRQSQIGPTTRKKYQPSGTESYGRKYIFFLGGEGLFIY